MSQSPPFSGRYEIARIKEDASEVHLIGDVTFHFAASMLAELKRDLPAKRMPDLKLNLDRVSRLDDYGLVLILQMRRWAMRQKRSFQLVATTSHARELAAGIKWDPLPDGRHSGGKPENGIVRLGGAFLGVMRGMRFHVSFLGSVVLALGHTLVHPRSLRGNDTVDYMERTGVMALPIVATISFLLGLIMAFVSALQLRPFGANIYVASLVVLAMVSELGPIMTAIVVAGRSGSAFAAEIGTMKISEEVDALFVMGFDPVLFVAVPRIVACLVVVPVLTIFSDIFAIAGGMMVGVGMLDLTPGSYMAQTLDYLSLKDISWGIFKSLVFAFTISWVACLRGFQARGGASAVGDAATSAVVSSIFLIILFDSIFAVIRSYW